MHFMSLKRSESICANGERGEKCRGVAPLRIVRAQHLPMCADAHIIFEISAVARRHS